MCRWQMANGDDDAKVGVQWLGRKTSLHHEASESLSLTHSPYYSLTLSPKEFDSCLTVIEN